MLPFYMQYVDITVEYDYLQMEKHGLNWTYLEGLLGYSRTIYVQMETLADKDNPLADSFVHNFSKKFVIYLEGISLLCEWYCERGQKFILSFLVFIFCFMNETIGTRPFVKILTGILRFSVLRNNLLANLIKYCLILHVYKTVQICFIAKVTKVLARFTFERF